MCLVILNHEMARLFLAHDRDMEETQTITSDYPPKENVERASMMTPSGMHSAEESEKIKQISADKLFHKLNDTLVSMRQTDAYERLIFTVPPDTINQLKNTLHRDLLERTDLFLPKILTKCTPMEILEHLNRELKE